MVGLSPQTGQFGSRRRLTSLNSVASASKRSSRPTSGSPIPRQSLSASLACSEPTMPGSTPSTPPSAQLGASSGGGVVDQVSRREVVGAVDDHVPAVGEDPLDVLRREPLDVGDDLDVRVELF